MFNRHKFFASYLQNFSKDYEKSLEGFLPDEQIHLTDTLLAILECYKQNPIDYKQAQKIQGELLKEYRKRLNNYNKMAPSEYFGEESMKHLDLQYDLDVENKGEAENFFTEYERKNFLTRAEILLRNHKRMLYLQTEPKTESNEDGVGSSVKTKGKTKRGAEDNVTALNQEQTALLIHFLQQTKIIFKDEDLNNKEAGQAFSLLTGYSADTLRQTLSKTEIERIATKKNLTELHNVLTRLGILIDNKIRGKK
ncbi:MAG: hypothetical protein HY840_02570 [Bacteroidetes bacterium]|nr:hypothetical protein [Bacteroidota bacterium]